MTTPTAPGAASAEPPTAPRIGPPTAPPTGPPVAHHRLTPRDIGRLWTSARLGVRLARRELRRRPWRTFLVLLLVFVPTAAMSFVVTALRTSERSAADQLAATWGHADHVVFANHGPAGPPTAEQIAEQLGRVETDVPPGSRLVVEQRLSDRVADGDRRAYLTIHDLPLDDPIADGRFGRRTGRTPVRGDEAVLSREAAQALDLDIGDSFTPDRLDRRLTVVGTVVVLDGDRGSLAFVGGPLPVRSDAHILVDVPAGQRIDDAVTTGDRYAEGGGFVPADELSEPYGTTLGVFWTYVGGGVGLLVLGTIITAAFAVGARRQLRSVGLLSATGASPSTVAWFLVAQGAVAGAVGSAAGVAVGVGVVALAVRTASVDTVTDVVGWPVEHATVRPAELVPIVVLGTLTAAVAAWLPARSAAQVPTLQALAGRRPLPRVPARLPLLGALSVGGGCGLLALASVASRSSGVGQDSGALPGLVAVAGSVAVLLGAIATAPWVIAGLERASGALPGSWRLAGRSLARSRVRSSAVVGAVVAVTATLIVGATLHNSRGDRAERRESIPWVRDDQVVIETYVARNDGAPATTPPTLPADVLRRIRAIVRGSEVVRLDDLIPAGTPWIDAPQGPSFRYVPTRSGEERPDDSPPPRLGVATHELLDHLAVPGPLRRRLDQGEAIGASLPPFETRSIEVTGYRPAEGAEVGPQPEAVSVPTTFFESPSASSSIPTVLVGRATAERLGYALHPGTRTLLIAPEPLTAGQRDRLGVLQADLEWERHPAPGSGPDPDLEYEGVILTVPPAPPPLSPAQVKAVVLAAALVLILAVVSIGLALAARDSEDEHQVLVAVGVPPRTLRRTAALQAVLLVLIAGLISTPAGLLPAAAIVAATGEDQEIMRFRPDPWALLCALLVVPALAGLATWVGGRLRDLVRRPRPDAFAFGD